MAEELVQSTIWVEDRSFKVQEPLEALQFEERGWNPVPNERV